MVNSIYIEKEIMENIQELPLNYRKQVLDFVRALRLSRPTGIAGSRLLKFANTIIKDDLLRMSQAIEENCERIDVDEW